LPSIQKIYPIISQVFQVNYHATKFHTYNTHLQKSDTRMSLF
jgi:hypothetical protein